MSVHTTTVREWKAQGK
nr:hypothetical protein [Bacillus sp. FDAARGOS_235]